MWLNINNALIVLEMLKYIYFKDLLGRFSWVTFRPVHYHLCCCHLVF